MNSSAFSIFTMILIFVLSGFTNAACPEQPCHNGGQCIGEIDPKTIEVSTSCRCVAPYGGEFCQVTVSNACDFVDCGHGTCQLKNNRLDSAQCVCLPGWTGPACSEIAPTCPAEHCSNNGICILSSFTTNGLGCVCNSGFTGTSCEINTNKCRPNSCPRNKQCIDQHNGFECVCPEGLVGPNCEHKDPCANAATDVCGYGFCVTSPLGVATCLCQPGFVGATCQIPIEKNEKKQNENADFHKNLIYLAVEISFVVLVALIIYLVAPYIPFRCPTANVAPMESTLPFYNAQHVNHLVQV